MHGYGLALSPSENTSFRRTRVEETWIGCVTLSQRDSAGSLALNRQPDGGNSSRNQYSPSIAPASSPTAAASGVAM